MEQVQGECAAGPYQQTQRTSGKSVLLQGLACVRPMISSRAESSTLEPEPNPAEAHSPFFEGGQASYRTESALRTAVNSPPAVCVWVSEHVTYMCFAICLPLAPFSTQPLDYLYVLIKQSLGYPICYNNLNPLFFYPSLMLASLYTLFCPSEVQPGPPLTPILPYTELPVSPTRA